MKYFPTRPFIFAIAILPFFCNCGKKEKPLAYSDRQWLMLDTTDNHTKYLQPIITQYFIDNKSEIWLLFLIAHSKR